MVGIPCMFELDGPFCFLNITHWARCSVLTAEVYVLQLATDFVLKNWKRQAGIFSDSLSVLFKIRALIDSANLFYVHIQCTVFAAYQLRRLAAFCYGPSHDGVPGNEADNFIPGKNADRPMNLPSLPYL